MTMPIDAMAALFEASLANDLPQDPNYNVCPTTQIAAVISEDGHRRLSALRWGFLPHWYKTPTGGPLLINARAETIAEKPAFKAAVRTRRCLIPASGFYEWTKDKTGARLPWYIFPPETPVVFAGIWQDWEREGLSHRSCAIVTVPANEKMQQIHHRQPLTLTASSWAKWLGEDGHGAATLMTAAPADALSFFRVGTQVNSNRATGASLIEPVDD